MDIFNIKSFFDHEIPKELSDNLFDSYSKGLREYSKGNWQYFINEIGQFNEIVYRILEYLLSDNYTPIKDKLPPFNEMILIKWENIPNKELNIKLIIPRILYSMFCIRNKRGAIHKNDINPNKMDASFLLSSTKWIIAELFRIFSKIDIIEAQKIIESITNKEIDLLWNINGKTRILNKNLKCCDQILVNLYVNNTMGINQLIENIEYSNKSTFKNILKKMHKERLIEYDGEICVISPKGLNKAELIIKRDSYYL